MARTLSVPTAVSIAWPAAPMEPPACSRNSAACTSTVPGTASDALSRIEPPAIKLTRPAPASISPSVSVMAAA